MKKEVAKLIADAADDIGVDVRLREHYSGRGMFGRTTTALTFDSISSIMQAVAQASRLVIEREDENELMQHHHFVSHMRVNVDSMGRGFVIY